MMQDAPQDKAKDTSDLRTVEIEGSQTPSQTVEKSQVITTSQANFGPDMSGSDDDEASEVDSFILDENDMEGSEEVLEPSKFLLAAETEEGQTLQTVDPETHARLEALLEAAGISKLSSKDGKALTDPEVLRTLTSSVSSALDEATQAINCMRSEQQGQIQGAEGAQALTERDVGTVRKLYESGSVPDTTEEGESLLSLACSAGYYELAQVLLAMNANVEDRGIKGDCTPLMEAASGGYVEIVRLLILHGADVNAQSSAGNTPLHSAACGGHTEVVKELINSGASVEVHNENGHTPLMEAASAGHVEVARLLLDAGAGINTHSNEFKESALTLACYKGHLEMVKFLLEAGADQEHKTDEMHTALMEASMDGHVEVARLLLDSGAQVNMPADSFESPLTLAACGGHVELANLLIERGANIEEVNDEGYTPLMEAAREGHEEMVALLLSHGADINAQTEETQETALTLACCGGFLEVADFLIKAGADIELGCSTPLMEAAQEGHLDLVRYLLTAGANVHAQTGTCDTALTYACENGHTDVAEVLLEHGAELEHESEGGRTPLMKAARAGHMCTVQFLISKGADVNRTTSTNDHTVLSLACAGGHMSVVELLLANGADSAHKLKDGSTMIIEAAKGGHTTVVKLLLEWPNRLLLNSSVDLAQPDMPHINMADAALEEPRVPVQGLAHIVPPSEPDSQLHSCLNLNAANQGKNADRQAAGKILAKRTNSVPGVDGKGAGAKANNAVIADSLQQLNHEGAVLADLTDEKATEKVEAIINNIMAKELLGPSAGSKEEQLQRKQQILEELQKVERELQEKAQAQQQLEQQQQLLKARSASASSPAMRQAEETAKKVLELNAATAAAAAAAGVGSPGLQRGLAESLCLTGTPAVDLPLNDLVVQLPKLLSSGDLAAAQSLIPNPAYATSEPYIQHPQSPVPPPATSVSSPTVSTLHQPQQQAPLANGNTAGGNSGSGGGGKASNKRNNSGKALRNSKSQQLQQPPLPPPPPQQQPQLPPSPQPLSQPLSSQVASLALNLQAEHNGGSQSAESAQANTEALQQQQQQLAALSQQQQQHLQQLTFPQLTPQQQDQLLQHMLSQQVLQPPLGQAPFQQPLHQLLPQQVQQVQQSPQQLTQQERAQLFHQTAQAQLLQQQLLKQTSAASPAPPIPAAPSPAGAGVANVAGDKNQSTLYQSSVDVDSQTESNHDTALTLACAGGHSELVSLLLAKGADIEHRDKKGFTPLILAATAGHVDVVEILLDHGADIEAQSERTKDTPLSLACSGGRYEVVELLLARGANKEHRNVSDYTPLSLAASGGYVNIIKLLLSHGAEINSRTGSKLGISPLMLAAMNGHTAAVKLLLDMGSDINAQIETNRNTALTLACFQGRHEVVSLLVDRKANIEHRAKTGLTPLMEAASGGYVEVGRVLLDKGADVNAPPVPSSRDTALTIAADKGHYRFVELLLHRAAAVDVKNKKGNSPLWLACNGGHLDVVQLLVSAGADIDSQDNRKVSCLMAAFRKGHVKVVKWMVRHVTQFPSDTELQRFIATVTDKELQKKCQQCMDTIVTAKDRQAAEANKNATSLLQEIDKEREVEEHRRQQAAKRRERRKERKKREKLEKEKDKEDKNSSPEPESADSVQHDQDDDDEEDDNLQVEPPSATVTSTIGTTLVKTEAKNSRSNMGKGPTTTPSAPVPPLPALPPHPSIPAVPSSSSSSSSTNNSSSATELRKNRRNRKEKWEASSAKQNHVPPSSTVTTTPSSVAASVATSIDMMTNMVGKVGLHSSTGSTANGSSSASTSLSNSISTSVHSSANSKRKKNDIMKQPVNTGKTRVADLDDFGSLSGGKISNKDVDRLGKHLEKVKINTSDSLGLSERDSNLAPKLSPLGTSPRKGQRKDEGWKEVIRKSKKVTVPSNAISRVIGRGGCNINAIRETSGAHVEVEKSSKGSGDRVITIKGSAEATRQAHAMINSLVQEPEKELSEIIARTKGKPAEKPQQTPATIGDFAIGMFSVPTTSSQSSSGNSQKSSTSGKSGTSRSTSSTSSAVMNGVRNAGLSSSGPQISAWQNPVSGPAAPSSPRRSPQKQLSTGNTQPMVSGLPSQDKSISRQLFGSDQRRAGSATPTTASTSTTMSASMANMKSTPTASITRSTSDPRQHMSTSSGAGINASSKPTSRPSPGSVRLLQRQASASSRPEPQPLPIVSSHVSGTASPATQTPTSSTPGNYSPFDNNIFSNVAVQFLSKREDEKLNFASVAAAGVVPNQSSPLSGQPPTAPMAPAPSHDSDPNLPAKAPGYKVGMRTASPQSRPDHPGLVTPNLHFQLPMASSDQQDIRTMGYRGPLPPGPGMPPHPSFPNPVADGGNIPPQGPQHMGPMEFSGPQSGPHGHHHNMHHHFHHHMGQHPHMPHPHPGAGSGPPSSQKEEYSTPHQPMTLPEIKSTLNPNAPDFLVTGSSMSGPPGSLVNGFPPSSGGDMRNGGDLGNSGGGGGAGNSGGGGGGFHPNLLALQQQLLQNTFNFSPAALQAVQQQLLNMQMMNPQSFSNALSQTTSFLAQAAASSGSGLDQLDLAQMSYNFMQHLANQRAPHPRSASPGLGPGPGSVNNGPGPVGPPHMGGQDGSGGGGGGGPMSGFMTPQGMARNVSPMPGGQHRPSSAPSLPDPGPSTPVRPSNMGSPMPPCTPPLTDGKHTPEDRRVPRPIGGERAQRKLPLNASSPGIGSGDFSNKLWGFSSDISKEWMSSPTPQMSAASLPSSVMTSSVVTGSNMAYNLNAQRENASHTGGGGMEGVGGFPDSLGGMDRNMDPSLQSQQMMMTMFANGLQGPYPMQPMFNSRGGSGGGGGGGGGVGDSGMPAMWSQGIKAGPNEAGDSEPWRNWSQTDM